MSPRLLPRPPFVTLNEDVAREALWGELGVALVEHRFGERENVYFARAGMAVKVGSGQEPFYRCRQLTKERGVEHRLMLVIRTVPKFTEKLIHRCLREEHAGIGETFRGPRTEALVAALHLLELRFRGAA